MDQRMLELQYRVEHEHPDGSWGQMVEDERPPHDAAETDPERGWMQRTFRCVSCGEVMRLLSRKDATGETPAPDAE